METDVESLQHSLADWKHIIVEADMWLRWDQESYPYLMCAGVSVIFLFLWLMQPPLLTTVSLLVMVVCLLDYLVPSVFKEYFSKQNWTEYKQERYQKFCTRLVSVHNSTISSIRWIQHLRENKPKHYFLGASITLAAIAFIGNAVPGLLLTYFIAIFLVLLPGLVHRGILFKYYALLLQVFVDLLRGHTKKD